MDGRIDLIWPAILDKSNRDRSARFRNEFTKVKERKGKKRGDKIVLPIHGACPWSLKVQEGVANSGRYAAPFRYALSRVDRYIGVDDNFPT